MGHRANLVIIEDAQLKLHYSGWGAPTLPIDLFWGPANARRFVLSHQEATRWVSDLEAEANCVLDFDTQAVMVHGGQDLLHNVPLRHLYLELMEHTWVGWNVGWAYRGVPDIQAHCGIRRDEVTPEDSPKDDSKMYLFDDAEEMQAFVSILNGDKLQYIATCDHSASDLIRRGSKFADEVSSYDSLLNQATPLLTNGLPRSGLHLDLSQRSALMWEADGYCYPTQESAARQWPGWTLTLAGDDWRQQAQLCQGLHMPVPNDTQLVTELTQLLLGERLGPSQLASQVAEQAGVELNMPEGENALNLDHKTRAHILTCAIASRQTQLC